MGAGAVTLNWADGEHRFELRIGELRELQRKCDAGPIAILRRLEEATWMVDDVRETVRLGLIGGGLTPTDAIVLTAAYVDERPLIENVLHARAILYASLWGEPDDKVGKAQAGKTRKKRATGGSSSRPSTNSAPPSDSTAGRSTP